MPRKKNVFVIGLDQANLEILHSLPDSDAYEFHGLSDTHRLLEVDHVELPALLDECVQQLERFDGPIDAIVGYWDFPVSTMVAILRHRFGLPGSPLTAVLKCEHKYWSRLEQQKVIDTHPGFGIIDLDGPARLPDGVGFPAWVKPVKSASSALAFHVHDDAELADALQQMRDGIDVMGDAFEHALGYIDLPPEIAQVGAKACLAEEAVGGRQVTVEGYSHNGEIHVYGIVDSILYPDSSSFLRYQYPADLPEEMCQRLARDSERVIRQVGLDNSTFNIEFFCDLEQGTVNLLEVNPRHSQSHAALFEYVDGVPNHDFMVRLGLGMPPSTIPAGQGPYGVAARWFLRRFTDGLVRRSPTEEEVRSLEEQVGGVTVHVVAQAGERLSDLPQQDSYSYELATLDIGAEDDTELMEKYQRCVEGLRFEFEE